jgi:ESCRT-I complex subunit TSG101
MVENNGDSYNVLVMQGTIAIMFRGQTYQILVDMYLPPGYPRSPPNCFVRLAPNMYLKSNHRHVGSDGKVYLPYLHEWDVRHNLIELVVAMSSVFSAEPPVFTRAAAQVPVAPAPPPERAPNTTTTFSPPVSTSPPPPPGPWQTQSEQEAILAVEIAEANEAAEAARRAEQAEKEQQEAAARARALMEQQSRQQRQIELQRKQALEAKLSVHLKQVRGDVEQNLLQLAKEHQRLECAATKVSQQLEFLRDRKKKAEEHLAATERSIKEIQEWLEHNETVNGASSQQKNASVTEDNVDELVQPSCPLSAQMLELASTNAAIGDALYFLDRALYRGVLGCDEHLKQVRSLAKQQFLTRAHMHKIQQALLRQSQC